MNRSGVDILCDNDQPLEEIERLVHLPKIAYPRGNQRGRGMRNSFEFFPPRAAEGIPNVLATLEELTAYSPAFVSVTYGAGGDSRTQNVSSPGPLPKK